MGVGSRSRIKLVQMCLFYHGIQDEQGGCGKLLMKDKFSKKIQICIKVG
jgi:hypothetical protein